MFFFFFFFFSEFPGWRNRRGTKGARAREEAARRRPIYHYRPRYPQPRRQRLNLYEAAMKDVANTAAEFFVSLTSKCRDNILDSNYRPCDRDPRRDYGEDGARCV